MKIFRIQLLMIFSLLTGCASLNTYFPTPNNQPHATILGSLPGILTYKDVYVVSIDNKPTKGQQFGAKTAINIALGKRKITINAFFRKHFYNLGGVYTQTVFYLQVKPGEKYVANAALEGNYITTWIVNSQQRIVTAKIKKRVLPSDTKVVKVTPLAK